jgi:hypothetical protein
MGDRSQANELWEHGANVLVQQWQTTSTWTGQTCEEYKTQLLVTQGITLLSNIEHYMSHFT